MISQIGSLIVNLSQDYETQTPLVIGLPDDEEFMNMMNIPAANNTNKEMPETSPPSNINETINSSVIPNAANEVPMELAVTVEERSVQTRPSKKRKQKTRKTRGKNQPRFALQGPEKLQFNAIGQPVGPDKKVSEFARFIGQLAAECTNFPLNAKSWREICKTDKVEEAWVTVTVCTFLCTNFCCICNAYCDSSS